MQVLYSLFSNWRPFAWFKGNLDFLGSVTDFDFFSKTSKIYKNFNVDHFKTSDLSAALEKVDVERQEPDGDSEKCQSEWDDVIVDETFARLVKV